MSIRSMEVRNVIDSLIRNDKDDLAADIRTRKYYRQEGNFLWINRHGLTSQADTLLRYLQTVGEMGFSPNRFCVKDIQNDIQITREMGFDEAHPINHVFGRLEYKLTKAYLRYATGQRFGYTNPSFLLNRLDTLKLHRPDTIRRPVRYRGLFDIKMDLPDDDFIKWPCAR